MIRLSTKTRFEAACLGKSPDKVIKQKVDLPEDWPYYETDCGWILVLHELEKILVFGEVPIDFSLTWEDWSLTQISKLPDPKYILNVMKAHNNLPSEFHKVVSPGVWKLENSRTGEVIEFSIKHTGSYYKLAAIGYPEKLEKPVDTDKIYEKDKLIETICNGLRPDIKKSDRGSE